MTDLIQFQNSIHFSFKNQSLLEQALVHRSSLNEHKDKFTNSNERLEFLGDAVVELWVSAKIYLNFPNLAEGDLTNLRSLIVRTETLAQIATKIELNKIVFLSRGEESHLGRQNISILADTFESLVGAIYLDSGIDASNQFLDNFLLSKIVELSSKNIYKDPKSYFQEISQNKEGITPKYVTLSETGPDHQKIFTVGLYINERQISTGTGPSKQKAEEDAAINAAKIY